MVFYQDATHENDKYLEVQAAASAMTSVPMTEKTQPNTLMQVNTMNDLQIYPELLTKILL